MLGPRLMRLIEMFRESIIRNPLVWILFAALLIAEYGNYSRGKELIHVCELLGPHDVAVSVPTTNKEEIDNICIDRQAEPEDAP